MKRATDLLITDDDTNEPRRLRQRASTDRPAELEAFLNAVARVLLAPSAPALASFIAGKVIQKLERTGVMAREIRKDGELPHALRSALQAAIEANTSCSAVARHVKELSPMLEWKSGHTGPFASLNFPRSHAHAVIVGPRGLEDRADIRVGMTFMEPYSRFPDHVQSHSRAFLLLSPAEILLEGRGWLSAETEEVFSNEAGRTFAMRCTSEPLLALWCHVEQGNR